MDDGVSESIGTILMVFILVALVGIMFGFIMGFGSGSPIDTYRPQYAIVDATVVPALSAPDTWNVDSIKIHFAYGNEPDLQYEEGVYTGMEGTKFMLIDPDGGSHEAMQSVTMNGQKINPGAEFYYFTVSSDISDRYYITNAYSGIADDRTWSGALPYPKPFAPGTWRVQIIDDSH